MKRIAIFASGSGSNAENIITAFQNEADLEVVLLLTNNPDAGVIQRGHRLKTPVLVFGRKHFKEEIVEILQERKIDWVILAGFLWLIPENLVKAFPKRIINIHPALLPAYGGKGMWGHHVHAAVVANQEKKSGITIHYVNEHYDEGETIFQATCEVHSDDSADTLAAKIHELEYRHFPEVIAQEIRKES
jgi:phosphoribosylglycinamide formyltransferase-1